MGLIERNANVEWIEPESQKPPRKSKRFQKVDSRWGKTGTELVTGQFGMAGEQCGERCVFEAIAQRMPVPIALTRVVDGMICYANESFYQLFGFEASEAIGTGVERLYYNPREALKLADLLEREGCANSYEVLAKKADGTPLWVSVTVESIGEESDRLWFHTFSAIEDLKQAEDILKTLENGKTPVTGEQFLPALASHLGSLLGASYVAILEFVGEKCDRVKVRECWEETEAGSYSAIAPVGEWEYQVCGTPEEEVMQRGSYAIADNWQASFYAYHPLAKLHARSYLGVSLLDISGKAIGAICLLDRQPLSNAHRAKAIVSIFAAQASADLERQRTQKALRDSEARLRTALKAARMGVWEWDLDKGKIYWSDEIEQILGLPKGCYSRALGTYIKTIYPEDRPAVRSAIVRAIALKTPYENEHRIYHATSNSVRWIFSKGEVLCDDKGKAIRLIETITDITDRKQTQADLIESESKLRAIFNSSTQSIVLIDTHYQIQAFNKSAREAVFQAWHREMQQGDSIYQYVALQDIEDFNQNFHACLQGQTIKIQRNVPGIGNKANWYEINYQPVFNDRSEVTAVCFSAFDITDRKLAVEALAKSEERFRTLVQNSSDIITILDADGTIRYESSSIERILGYKQEELLEKNAFEYVHPEDRESVAEVFASAVKEPGALVELEFRFRHANGKWVYLESVGNNLLEQAGINGFVVNSRDITDRREQEERLRLFERAIAASSNGIVISENRDDCPVVYVNPSFEKMTGYSAADTIGKNCRFLQGRDRDQSALKEIRQAIRQGKDCKVVLRNYRKDGSRFWNELSLSPVENDRGQIAHFIGVQTDISDRKRVEEELIHQAYYDSLTGLPNRAFFMERLREATTEAETHADRFCAVLFIDLDRFKRVNDSLGHAVGDMLLIAIAFRLERCLDPQNIIARLGGDHYVILLNNIRTLEDATAVAEKIHDQLKPPFTFEGHEVFITASIGIAMSAIDYEVSADLLRNADIAMYRAKAAGKARHAVFDRAMYDRAVQLLQLENDLRRELHEVESLHDTSFRLAYQPIVSLDDGQIVGFEALVRWHHPERGFISPGEFIPLAEETGTIVPLGSLVLREACRQLVEWQARFQRISQTPKLKMSVNLSGKQFLQPQLVEQIEAVLEETGLDPACLKLEITESVLVEDTQTAIKTLLDLKQRQIHLSLDDFGTGYSSLSHLAQFPIDTLKIDKSFVSSIGMKDKNLQIVSAIVTLAHALGMDVTAEGIETPQQLAQLKTLGCNDGQGYFFSKPVYADAATALLMSSIL